MLITSVPYALRTADAGRSAATPAWRSLRAQRKTGKDGTATSLRHGVATSVVRKNIMIGRCFKYHAADVALAIFQDAGRVGIGTGASKLAASATPTPPR